MELTPSKSHIVLHPSRVLQSVQPKSFVRERKERKLAHATVPISPMNSASKSGSCELPTVSPISSKEHCSSDFQTMAVPIVVVESTGNETGCSPNCFLYQIGSNLYTSFIPMISTLSTPENEDQNERDQNEGGEIKSVANPGDLPQRYTGYSPFEKQELRKMRQRTTFTKYVKHRILNLYRLYRMSGSKLSIRSIAYKIYSQLSKESFVRCELLTHSDFQYTFKNIITLLYNTRHKK